MSWLAKVVPGTCKAGKPILSVVAKKTYRFSHDRTAVEEIEGAIQLVETEEYLGDGDPNQNPILHEVDLVAYKPLTDVVFHGRAKTPQGRKAYQIDVSVKVRNVIKTVRVFGNRQVTVTANGFLFSKPDPFAQMPLSFDYAYGGKDGKSDPGCEHVYRKNPIGKGFIMKPSVDALQGLSLPNLEDPKQPLQAKNLVVEKPAYWQTRPDPAGFGWVGRNFWPRYTLAGVPFEQWAVSEAERSHQIEEMEEVGGVTDGYPPPATPLLNPMFHCGASKKLSFPYLSGSETIWMAHMDANQPRFCFHLPGEVPQAILDTGAGGETLPMVLQTVEVMKEASLVSLVWRGSRYYGGLETLASLQQLDFEVRTKG